MPWPSRMPRGRGPLGRRALLVGVVGSGALALAGCGIHLEDDAPNLPLVPRRTPIGAETLLLALLANSRELDAACGTWTSGPQVALAPRLRAIHRQQADVLAALLADAHVPADLVAAAVPSSGASTGSSTTSTGAASGSAASPSSAPSPAAPATSATIAALQNVALRDAPGLAAAPAQLLPTIAAILAQRYAAAAVVGGAAPILGPTGMTGPQASTTSQSSPSGTASGSSPSSPATTTQPTAGSWDRTDLVAELDATRSAVYGFEVVAAQGDPAGRALGLRTLATLAAIQTAQEAALTSPAPPGAIGYTLPFSVTTPALARKLASRVATGLRAAYGSQLGAAAQGSVPFLDLVRWLGQAEVVGHDWGGALVPFPGMTTP